MRSLGLRWQFERDPQRTSADYADRNMSRGPDLAKRGRRLVGIAVMVAGP